ncbi:NADH pyrophosphatase [Lobosporangium transversale]|nr:NADH pyrophosphatase [Lobosporangium transversale]
MSNQSSHDVFEAAASGDLEMIKGLGRIHLEAKNDRATAKVDAETENKDGKTAAELAEFWGSTDCAAVFDRLAPNKKKVQHSTGSPFASSNTNNNNNNNNNNSAMAAGAGLVSSTGNSNNTNTNTENGSMADWWKRRTVLENKPLHFTGSTHNRTDKEYLEESVKAPSTRFLILADHGVMFKSSTKHLAFAQYEDVQHLIGSDPLNNLPEGLVLVFLGADETNATSDNEVLVRGRRGIGYWALDMSAKGPRVTAELKDAVEKFINTYTEKHGHYMAEMRPAAFGLSFAESGLVAQARAVIDWNKRNQFCTGCGRRNLSLDGGHKRTCPPMIQENGQEVPSDCLAHKGIQNFTYPRTAVWPKGMYSCLAGFVEPGESLEEAARREVKEESGIRLGHVMYHSSQPWPFPNSLMIGCHAEALNEDTNVTLEDKELEDARWFTRAQILEALKGSRTAVWGKPSENDSLRLPPATAIAHHILKAWATEEGEIPHSRM